MLRSFGNAAEPGEYLTRSAIRNSFFRRFDTAAIDSETIAELNDRRIKEELGLSA
ncbi:MAG: hypothetical protein JWO97_715 [Acidobacteria bacterium]|nr:hypothetical protein [Acidobacteriota bacterium]